MNAILVLLYPTSNGYTGMTLSSMIEADFISLQPIQDRVHLLLLYCPFLISAFKLSC